MNGLTAIAHQFHPENVLRAGMLLAGGYIISRLLGASIDRIFSHRLRQHQIMLVRRGIFSLVFLLFLASAIEQMGFRIDALLGATGILTLAFGIASQTSMSNFISGIFIIGEKPFEIGDSVSINGLQGEIVSIGFMSVRIRTPENTMIRIPNETLIKSAITNLSHYPTRRISIETSISYREDIEKVRELLNAIAKNNPLCLKEPAPCVLVDTLGESAVNLQLQVWTATGNIKELKSQLQAELKRAFDEHHIETPPPRNSVYLVNGNSSEQLPESALS